jgi:hypothetical protein
MKKAAIISLIAIAIVIGLFFALENLSAKKGHTITNELVSISEKFESSIFKSFYSIENIRPYSIVHIDKISEIYENKWISPNDIVAMLEKNDKLLLLEMVSDFAMELKPEQRSKYFSSIKSWCISDMQFSFLSKAFDFSNDEIIEAITKTDGTNMLLKQFSPHSNPKLSKLSAIEKNQLISNAQNIISKLTHKEQMHYYSSLYKNLAK